MTTLELLQKLVAFPTHESDGMKRCAHFLSSELRDAGFNVVIDELNNVYGTKEFAGREEPFLINAHFDTVPPSTRWKRDPLRVSTEGDRLYGLGTSDAKGGITAILLALKELKDCRFKKLEVLFANYEDNAAELNGARWLGTPFFLAHNKLEAKSGINVEGTVQGDRFMVSLGCGGRVAFDIEVIGREAHTAEPSWRTLGRNAIYDTIKVIEALRRMPPAKMTIDDSTVYTDVNVSTIHGGTVLNVVPGECKIECERRVLPNENWENVKMQVENSLRVLRDIEFKVHYYPPQRSYLIDRSDPIVELIVSSVQHTLGYTPKFRAESGRTDSGYFNELAGIKTVILGPGEGITVEHKPDEYTSARKIEEFTRIMHQMLNSQGA